MRLVLKKFFAILIISLSVMTTSCQKENQDTVVAKGAWVSVEVKTPEIATRNFGDGTMANDLYYAVYDEDGVMIGPLSKIDESRKETIHISKTVSMNLAVGKTYSMIFWADNVDDVCDVDFESKTMSFDPSVANKEQYDAFWAYVKPFKVEGDISMSVNLYRPFAQLNIAASDYDQMAEFGADVTESQVVVKIPTSLNLVDGSVSGDKSIVYSYADIPQGEEFPVAGHKYLSMNYLLAGAEKSTIDVEFFYKSSADVECNTSFSFVPVQRNYRTNIFGALLTGSVDISIVIEPAYYEPDYNIPVVL